MLLVHVEISLMNIWFCFDWFDVVIAQFLFLWEQMWPHYLSTSWSCSCALLLIIFFALALYSWSSSSLLLLDAGTTRRETGLSMRDCECPCRIHLQQRDMTSTWYQLYVLTTLGVDKGTKCINHFYIRHGRNPNRRYVSDTKYMKPLYISDSLEFLDTKPQFLLYICFYNPHYIPSIHSGCVG